MTRHAVTAHDEVHSGLCLWHTDSRDALGPQWAGSVLVFFCVVTVCMLECSGVSGAPLALTSLAGPLWLATAEGAVTSLMDKCVVQFAWLHGCFLVVALGCSN